MMINTDNMKYNKKNYPTFLVKPTKEQIEFFNKNKEIILKQAQESKTEHLKNYPITKFEVLSKNKTHHR